MKSAPTPVLALLVLGAFSGVVRADMEVNVLLKSWAVTDAGLSTSVGSAGGTLGVGEPPKFTYLSLGEGRCIASTSRIGSAAGPPAPATFDDARHAWIAAWRVASVENESATIEVDWTRLTRDADRLQETTTRESYVLRPTDDRSLPRFPLEIVGEDADDCPYRRVLVGLEASIVEDPELADARLAHELWWEHVDDSGRMTTRRLDLDGTQGEVIEAAMPPIRWPVPGHEGFEVILAMEGRLQARLRQDGAIDVTLDVDRHHDVERAGEPRRGGLGDGGEKSFSLVPGETVRMELPPIRSGWVAVSTTHDRSAVVSGPLTADSSEKLEGTDVRVEGSEFFAGHRDALVLTSRRLD